MEKATYITELEDYIQDSKYELILYMREIGWNANINVPKNYIPEEESGCTSARTNTELNDSFSLLIKSLQDHAMKSDSSRNGSDFIKNELPDPIPKCFLGHPKMALTIDQETKLSLLQKSRTKETLPPPPSTVDDYFANYSFEERDILYRYVIQNCVKVKAPPELVVDEPSEDLKALNKSCLTEKEEHLLKLQRLQKERDLKRRRQAYRRKVTTKNKSQTEVTSEVIANMMEALGYTNNDPDESPCEITVEKKSSEKACHGAVMLGSLRNDIWASPPGSFDRFRFCRNHRSNPRNFSNTEKLYRHPISSGGRSCSKNMQYVAKPEPDEGSGRNESAVEHYKRKKSVEDRNTKTKCDNERENQDSGSFRRSHEFSDDYNSDSQKYKSYSKRHKYDDSEKRKSHDGRNKSDNEKYSSYDKYKSYDDKYSSCDKYKTYNVNFKSSDKKYRSHSEYQSYDKKHKTYDKKHD